MMKKGVLRMRRGLLFTPIWEWYFLVTEIKTTSPWYSIKVLIMILFWPRSNRASSLFSSQTNTEKDSHIRKAITGFAIGWNYFDSDNDAPCRSAGIVSAGIIPNFFSHKEIQSAICKLQNEYMCHCKRTSTSASTSSHIPARGDKCREECTLIQGLKVVAFFNGDTGNHNNVNSECNLPIIVQRQWQPQDTGMIQKDQSQKRENDGSTANVIFIADNNANAVEEHHDVVFYDPCPYQSLDHYHYSHLNKRNFDVPVEKEQHHQPFGQLLLKLSEAETILNLLHEQLLMMRDEEENRDNNNIENSRSNDNSHISASVVTSSLHTSSILKTNEQKKTHSCNTIKSITLSSVSLTLLHLKNQSIRFHSPTLHLLSLRSWKKATKSSHSTIKPLNQQFQCKQNQFRIQLHNDDHYYHILIDGIVGSIMGILILYFASSIVATMSYVWDTINGTLLRDNIGWLETFPVGFKLNVPLTRVMGKVTLWIMDAFEQCLLVVFVQIGRLSSILQVLSLQYVNDYNTISDHDDSNNTSNMAISVANIYTSILGVISIVFGFKLCCAIFFDTIRLCTLHMSIMTNIYQQIYRIQLSHFSSLFYLFQGKKKNVLRARSDSLEFDFMQLLLGMILFTICLFLFTTIVVYYAFFTCIYFTVAFCVLSVWGWYWFLDDIPLGYIVHAWVYPKRFCTKVDFFSCNNDIDDDDHNDANVRHSYYKLEASNLSTNAFMILFLASALGKVASFVPSIIVETMCGESFSFIQKCLEIVTTTSLDM